MYKVKKNYNTNILLNIPHSSTKIPEKYINTYFLKGEELSEEAKVMADLYTDELFESEHTSIVAEYSRIFTDIERFRENKCEEMYKKGMGVLYTKTSKNDVLREIENEEELKINYYDKYHTRLNELSEDILNRYSTLTIIDCHSFPSTKQPYQLYDERVVGELPDICIGYEEYHCDEDIVKKIKDIFEIEGYIVGINMPYSGSIVPMKYYKKDKRVKSIMIEINRKTYMCEETFQKTEGFKKVKNILEELLVGLR